MERLNLEVDGPHGQPARRVTGTVTAPEVARTVRPLATLAPSSVRALQRAAGNRATTAVVSRQVEPVQRECGGGACSCHDCSGSGQGDAEQETAPDMTPAT